LNTRCETISRRIEYGNLFGRKDMNSGLTSGFHDIALAHDALRVCEFLAKKAITKSSPVIFISLQN
jgi:hypothetical protein